MKKKLSVLFFIGVSLLTATVQAQQTEETKKAREELAAAQKELKEAKLDSAADYAKFKAAAESSLLENKKRLAQLRAKQTADSTHASNQYHKKVAELEKQNAELEAKLNGSEHTSTSMWTRFKLNFNRDMSKLVRSINNL